MSNFEVEMVKKNKKPKNSQTMGDLFVIKNLKSLQPKGCSGLKFSLALNSPYILGYLKSREN
ncbi:MAG: hypothetical protein CSA39_01575 [Flavobacteriales bacterium]|nr:MAG: hypothetical protein CSA39_01575 [Flavobacteriales bacterium]